MSQTNNISKYFPNLNGLRFIAAFMVVISHIELFKSYYFLPNIYNDLRFQFIGKLGVQLFFVLSGFLITYLLLTEKENKRNINIKNFYVRRILRIWPLYFLIAILGLFVLPYIHLFDVPSLSEHVKEKFGIKILFTFLFLPNVIDMIYPFLPFTFQLWSIAVEEQFYLFAPWIMKKSKNTFAAFIWVIISVIAIKYAIKFIYFYYPHYLIKHIYNILYYFSIDSMAIGALGAHLYYFKFPILQTIYNKYFQILNILVFILYYYFQAPKWPYFQDEFYAFVFGIIVINAATNKNSIIKLENKLFNYLGTISYSTYMVHLIALAFSFGILNQLDMLNNVRVYALSIAVTYLLSIIVNKYFESWFIAFKSKFNS